MADPMHRGAPVLWVGLLMAGGLIALALESAGNLSFALGIAVVGAAVAILLNLLVPPVGRVGALVPPGLALAYLSVTTVVSDLGEVLAGIASLSLLLWVAVLSPHPSPLGRRSLGLLLPALGLGIALATAVAVPVAQQVLGVAVLLIVIAIALVAWAVAAPGRLAAPSGS